ncbi:hypothetical protein [Streptomyces sp. AC1-42T]|uniref:hypothetical protein n=1 Tax=Streptomyces sp. AC1-42T TaxID=2218665 RepID=UPI000DAF95CB|nr:hypothetical protein [Streptomyces sp. AC1-42T]PZT71510.1 hypothetical protein DNK55_32890 [Streptomyces sp. AC1-42T]
MTTPPAPQPHHEALHHLTAQAVKETTASWEQLVAAQQDLVRALSTAQRRRLRAGAVPPPVRAALRDFTAATARFDSTAGALAERWAAVDLPLCYRLGAEEAMRRAVLTPTQARPAFAWHDSHQRVLATVTAECYPVLVRRFTEVVRRAQAFARAVAAAARSTQPPPAELAARHSLSTVTYANDAAHPATSWARATFTAQSITAANAGALTATTVDLDAIWVQVTDGPECGWTSHPELDRAHNTIRSAEQAAVYPIAHPGCLREFIPRPDLNTATVKEGQPI